MFFLTEDPNGPLRDENIGSCNGLNIKQGGVCGKNIPEFLAWVL